MATQSLAQFNHSNLSKPVSAGQIFSVEFIQQTIGGRRQIPCRQRLKSYLKGGSKSFKAKAKNLISVFDMDRQGYQSIPVDGVSWMTVGDQSFYLRQSRPSKLRERQS